MRRPLVAILLLLGLPAQAATVLSIGDGDTLRVAEGGRKVTIRLACIDAPETAQSTYGARSRNLLANLAPVGSEVSLRVVDTDRYGRTVAEILRGRQNVNLQMVRHGQAYPLRRPAATPIASTCATMTPPPTSGRSAGQSSPDSGG